MHNDALMHGEGGGGLNSLPIQHMYPDSLATNVSLLFGPLTWTSRFNIALLGRGNIAVVVTPSLVDPALLFLVVAFLFLVGGSYIFLGYTLLSSTGGCCSSSLVDPALLFLVVAFLFLVGGSYIFLGYTLLSSTGGCCSSSLLK